jgi:hypothetical protein
MRVLLLALALALGGCAAMTYGDKPVAEIGQPDTYRFKVYVNAFATETFAWEQLQPDIEAYRKSNGFGSYTVTSRSYMQGGYFEYSVRFVR